MKKKLLVFSFVILLFFILFLFFFQPLDSIQDLHTSPEISIVDNENNEILHLIQNHKTTPIKIEKMNEKNISILLD
ncbi:MAG: hypothetical protein K2J85_04560, partial [Anaeroplasmataceae bacterium]|nr:hypothetical protein [Anaeroplasmataceae bacterium]